MFESRLLALNCPRAFRWTLNAKYKVFSKVNVPCRYFSFLRCPGSLLRRIFFHIDYVGMYRLRTLRTIS
jgi:hypothetical protein